MLCAFDLIELDGKNLRRTPIEERKYALVNLGALRGGFDNVGVPSEKLIAKLLELLSRPPQ